MMSVWKRGRVVFALAHTLRESCVSPGSSESGPSLPVWSLMWLHPFLAEWLRQLAWPLCLSFLICKMGLREKHLPYRMVERVKKWSFVWGAEGTQHQKALGNHELLPISVLITNSHLPHQISNLRWPTYPPEAKLAPRKRTLSTHSTLRLAIRRVFLCTAVGTPFIA